MNVQISCHTSIESSQLIGKIGIGELQIKAKQMHRNLTNILFKQCIYYSLDLFFRFFFIILMKFLDIIKSAAY